MQTLGLSNEEQRSDGWLKRIFWPIVKNAWDVNSLGRQGFWICVAIAAFQFVFVLPSGNIVMILAGAVVGLAFLIGGMGVREGSWPAAALVFSIYFLGLLYSMASGIFPGFLAIIAAALLLTNLRAAFLASEWRPATEEEDRPTRFNESFTDKLVDQLPAKLWPILQIPFFVLSALLVLATLAGVLFALALRLGISAPGGGLHP